MRIVVAVGGNALIKAGQAGTWAAAAGQRARDRRGRARAARARARGRAHARQRPAGRRAAAADRRWARARRAPLPLDALIAMTQGQIGYLLESAFAALDPSVPIAVLLTRVLVDPRRPRVRHADQAGRPVLRRGRGAPPRAPSSAGTSRPTPAAAGGGSCPARTRSKVLGQEHVGRAARARRGRHLLRRRRDPRGRAGRRGRRRRRRDRQGPLLGAPRGRDRRRRARAADRRAARGASTSARAGSASSRG